MSQELISRMLELCEEHMNEGDYLESARVLKEVHLQNREHMVVLRTPFRVLSVDEDDDFASPLEIIKVVAFEWNDENSSNMKIIVENGDLAYKLDLYESFENYVLLMLESNSVRFMKIEGSILPNKIYYGLDIINRLKYVNEFSDNKMDLEPDYVIGYINESFKDIIVSNVKYTCKVLRTGRPFH